MRGSLLSRRIGSRLGLTVRLSLGLILTLCLLRGYRGPSDPSTPTVAAADDTLLVLFTAPQAWRLRFSVCCVPTEDGQTIN